MNTTTSLLLLLLLLFLLLNSRYLDIRGYFQRYALYKSTFYLLTYLLTVIPMMVELIRYKYNNHRESLPYLTLPYLRGGQVVTPAQR